MDAIRTSPNCNHRKISGNILLTFNLLINGQQDFKAARRFLQKLAILETAPARLLYSADFVTHQFNREFAGQTFIEKNAHWILEPRGRSRVLPLPVRV